VRKAPIFDPSQMRLLHVATLYITRPRREDSFVEWPVEFGIEWHLDEALERRLVRERVAFTIMVAILIFLFAFTFAILGKGSYEPSTPSEGGSVERQASLSASA
jgi:hypothetical protein